MADTPLHLAVRWIEDPAVIQALVDAGADVDVKNADGDTPLHLAVRWIEDPAVIQALVDAGADVDVKNDYGDTPLQSCGSLD